MTETIAALRALAGDEDAPLRYRVAAGQALALAYAAENVITRWAGPTNAEVRVDVVAPTTVRSGEGAQARLALKAALDELARTAAPTTGAP